MKNEGKNPQKTKRNNERNPRDLDMNNSKLFQLIKEQRLFIER